MILTNRKIPKDLLYYRALQKRIELDGYAQKKLEAFEKGYAGELLYDSIFDEIISHLNVFRDIYLKVENSTLQCDTLIVCDEGLVVNEIKNFKGIYTYENEKWYVRNKQITEDPISQLKRTTNTLIKFQYMYNLDFNSDGKIIFPNPDFSLETSHPSANNYMVLRPQLRRYFHGLNQHKSTQRSDNLIQIIQNHIVDNPFFNYSTNYDDLKQGIYCRRCSNFNLKKSNFHFDCLSCGNRETLHTLIVQALSDYNILFDKNYITRDKLSKLLGNQISQTTLNRYLKKYCKKINKGPATQYKFKYYDFDDAIQNETRLWRYKDMPKSSITQTSNYNNL